MASQNLLSQANIDGQNADFWSDLCGSVTARMLGISDHSPASLKIFDDWYMAHYPYLSSHVPYADMSGLKILEIGLGYGTLSQKLAEHCSSYTGLDISPAPAAMVNDRMKQAGLNGKAHVGSILNAPFEDESFDRVVAIGCFHHTGDMQRSIDESYRVLKPGGKLILMVYNAYSYRRWLCDFSSTIKYFFKEMLGLGGPYNMKASGRAQYDTDLNDNSAPHSDVISKKSLRKLCRRFSKISIKRENMGHEFIRIGLSRTRLLQTFWPRICGLDLYATCVKPGAKNV